MTRPLPTWLLSLALFLFIYNISFKVLPPATTGRLVLLVMLACYLPQVPGAFRRAFRGTGAAFAMLGLVIIYGIALFALASGGDTVQLSRLLNFTFYVVLGVPLFALASGWSHLRFTRALVFAASVQAAFIFISFVSPAFRIALAERLVQGGNIPLTYALQVPGLSNSTGALLSLIQATGVFAALYLLRQTARPQERRWLPAAATFCALSTLVVGRTGLQLSVILFVSFAVAAGPVRLLRSVAVVAMLLLLTAAVAERLVTEASKFNESARATADWAFDFFIRGRQGTFIREFAAQELPEPRLELLIGTGRVVSPDGVDNASGSDSGYIQTLYALGAPMALIFYLSVAVLVGVVLQLPGGGRAPLAFLAFIMFAAEIKEPFIFKYTLPFTLLTLVVLSRRTEVMVDTQSSGMA